MKFSNSSGYPSQPETHFLAWIREFLILIIENYIDTLYDDSEPPNLPRLDERVKQGQFVLTSRLTPDQEMLLSLLSMFECHFRRVKP